MRKKMYPISEGIMVIRFYLIIFTAYFHLFFCGFEADKNFKIMQNIAIRPVHVNIYSTIGHTCIF